MTRYDERNDRSMRGDPRLRRPGPGRNRRLAYDRFFDDWYSPNRGEVPLPNRVTRRYNREYVDDRVNEQRSYGLGGDRFDRMGGEDFYRPPYLTIGGTRTSRGSRPVRRLVPGRFGPSFGGRFPDEVG